MTTNQSAGIGDPYWYEWSVGQLQLIRMLNPDNGIKSVTFQDQNIAGWDDIVVEYDNFHHFYQVKHTRTDESITFGDLVHKDESGKSLLGYLSQCWQKHRAEINSKYIVFTNRQAGARRSSITIDNKKIRRPPLESFLQELKDIINKNQRIVTSEIQIEFQDAFKEEWGPALEGLSEDEVSQFISSLEIQANQDSLEQLEIEMVSQIQDTFSINKHLAEEVLKFLDSGLRKWTTTRGKDRKITSEIVFQELGKQAVEEIYVHYEPPPVPFFNSRVKVIQEIAAAIKSPENKVVFLSGSPGSGKTSIISQLTNNRLPIIHLRYYTFHPISPENDTIPMDAGQAVTATRLWGDLLTQIREYLKGSLAKHRVPIRNDFILDPIELRSHVIRLSRILAKEIKSDKLVICIDGIDHAARSGIDVNENYLSTLLPPDQIPDELLFIIAGQPAESYPRYPVWLKEVRPDVKKISLDNLERRDITDYCYSKGIQNPEGIALELFRITSGNTLSVIYAVATIQKYENPVQAMKELEEFRMQDGLIAYYNSIWDKLNQQFGEQKTIPVFIACFFSLTTAKLKASHFISAMGEFNRTELEWRTALKYLSPLIIGEPDGYRVLHNDIRVFFSKIALDRSDIYNATAAKLVDLYLIESDFCKQRHTDLSRLLSKASNSSRILDILNPQFILEAYICGGPLSETYEQIKLALYESLKIKSFEKLHEIVCSIFTLNQLESSLRETDGGWEFDNKNEINISELRVLRRAEWNADTISDVLDQILSLYRNNYQDRATGLWDRWFSSINIHEMLLSFFDKKSEGNAPFVHSPNLEKLSSLLGKISIYRDIPTLVENLPRKDDAPELEKMLSAKYSAGLIEEVRHSTDYRIWGLTKKKRGAFFITKDYDETFSALVATKDWRSIRIFLNLFDSKVLSPEYRTIAFLCSLFLKKERIIRKWILTLDDILLNLSSSVSKNTGFEIRHIYYTITCFLLGWQHRHLDVSEVVSKVSDIVFSRGHDSRDEPGSRMLFRMAAELGQWFKEIFNENKKTDFLFLKPERLSEITSALLNFQGKIFIGGASLDRATIFLLEIIAFSIERTDAPYQAEVKKIFESEFSGKTVYNPHFPIIWKYLYNKGMYSNCQSLLANILSDTGKLWNWSIGERFSALDELENLTRGTHFFDQVKSARLKSNWYQIGITSHKDYSFYNEYNWLESLLELSPERWSSDGYSLLKLSNKLENTGDNRAHRDIEKLLLFTAFKTDPATFYPLFQEILSQEYKYNHDLLSSAIDDFINTTKFTEIQVKLIWILVCSTSYWIDYNDRKTITSIKNKILTKYKGEISDIESFVHKSFPLEDKLEVYIQSENESEYDKEYTLTKSLDEELDEYIAGRKENISYLSSIIRETGKTRPGNFQELIFRILGHLKNLQKRSWWGYSGLERIYKPLLPLLTPDQKWAIAGDIIDQFYHADEFVSLQSLATSLDRFCLYCNNNNESELNNGLRRLQSMHFSWISGFEESEPLEEHLEIQEEFASIRSFNDAVFQILLDKLDTRSSIQIEAALQGIFNYLLLFPEGYQKLESLWKVLSNDQIEYLLFCLEASAAKDPEHFDIIKPFLDKSYLSRTLSHRLQSYLVYLRYNNITGMNAPEFSFQESEELKKLGEFTPGTINPLSITPESDGYILHSHHLYQRKLDFLFESALIVDREAYSRSITFLEKDREIEENLKPALLIRNDFAIHKRDADDIVNEVYDHNAFTGNLPNHPLALIAQCLLPNDDPIALLNPYIPFPELDLWPNRYGDSDRNLQSIMREILRSGLPEGVSVIGGIVSLYRKDGKNSQCRYNTYLFPEEMLFSRKEWDSTFNSRSSFAADPDTYEPENSSNGLFIIGGGISKFIFMNNWIWPSRSVMNKIGWEFDSKNPTRLIRNSIEVAWQEKFIGNLDVGIDRSKTPVLQRWVCRLDELERIRTDFPDYKLKEAWGSN